MPAKFLGRKSHTWALRNDRISIFSRAKVAHYFTDLKHVTFLSLIESLTETLEQKCVHWPDDLLWGFVSRISVISCDIVVAYASTCHFPSFHPTLFLILELFFPAHILIHITYSNIQSLSLDSLHQSGLTGVQHRLFRL